MQLAGHNRGKGRKSPERLRLEARMSEIQAEKDKNPRCDLCGDPVVGKAASGALMCERHFNRFGDR